MINRVDGSTKIAGIFGYPIKHTLSPAMHNAAFEYLKLNTMYLPFQICPEKLGTALRSLKSLNILGINVTVPHKENAVKYVDTVNGIAEKIGAINTIVIKNDKLTGYNTDGPGFIKSIEGKYNISGRKILLLGAGGAGKAIGVTLGNSKIREINIYDTEKKRAERLLNKIRKTKQARLIRNKYEIEKIMPEIDMLINATPVGMHKEDKCVISPELLHKKLFVYDIVYNRETTLIKEAKKIGCRCTNGLGMLLYQGVLAFELWTGRKAPVEIMRRALLRALL